MSTSSHLTFSTKPVRFHGDTRRILLQNENGPCPLLALMNALILKGKLQLPSGSSKVNSSELQHQLVGHIVDSSMALGLSVPGGDQQARAANLQHQIDDTIKLVMMGRFIEGMDVNLLFGDCTGFEYTRELAVFDLCGVSLLHGWIADSSDSSAMKKLCKMSYNEATLAVLGGLEDDPLVASLRSSLSASARHQLTSSMALSTDVPQIDAIASTSQVDVPQASGGSDALDSTQASASTDDSDVQDVVSDIVARVSEQAESSNSIKDVDTLKGANQPSQTSEPLLEAAQPSSVACNASSRSASGEACTQAELHAIAQFLQDSQSQLTVSGLITIADHMHEGSVAAFFRNNHFNTLYKHHDGALYVLVTDEGYINEEGVVWERLCSEIGDTTYVSADFEAYGVFRDRQVAEQEEALRQIRLAEQANLASSPAAATQNDSGVPVGAGPHIHASQADSDYALALQLHQAEQEAAQRQNAAHSGAPQTTLQGAVRPHSGAASINEGPRRFSGARHSGPVYVEPNQGRPGRQGGRQGGRTSSSSDNCRIM